MGIKPNLKYLSSVPTRQVRNVVFCALESYSVIGGLQAFNKRLIRHLGQDAVSNGSKATTVLLLRDEGAEIPTVPGVRILALGASRINFLLKSVFYALRDSNILLLGSINIIIIAFIIKIFKRKTKTVLFIHGDDVWNDERYRKKKFYDRFFLQYIDHIASVSEFTANIMAREFALPLDKFTFLPNAVDPISSIPSRARTNRTVLVVTRLAAHDAEKNVDKLIRSVKLVREKKSDVILEIVGDGVLRAQLEGLALEIGVRDNVKFLGHINDEELKAAYARAAVFAMPSSKEGFGIVYLEAWQFGLPVICSKFGASAEIVSDGIDGFVVDPSDIEVLARKIDLLLSDEVLSNRLGSSGREKVNNMYLDENFGKNLQKMLGELSL